MKNDVLAKKAINLYSGSGWKSLFARIRFWDAPYKQVEEMVPREGNIVDLGCGEGLFSNYLALGSKKRNVFGIEIDKNRIKHADKGLPNTHFACGNISKADMPSADAIILMHVLHHLGSFNQQEELLKVCLSKLRNKGRLIIVEAEPKFSLKYLLTFLADHFLVAWIFERKLYSAIYFRKNSEWIRLLNKIGFKVRSYPADRNKPFTHIVFECSKF